MQTGRQLGHSGQAGGDRWGRDRHHERFWQTNVSVFSKTDKATAVRKSFGVMNGFGRRKRQTEAERHRMDHYIE